jgi:site-specific recombinase XerD
MTEQLFDVLGRRRSPATLPGFNAGRSPASRGKTYRPTILTPQDVERVLENCPVGISGSRLRALIAVLYRTGMAISETLGLLIEDLDLTTERETVRIRTGRLAQRTLALDTSVVSLLGPWLEVRNQMPGTALFCTCEGASKGSPWDGSSVRTALRDVANRVGWNRLVPGDLRFSFVTELMVEQWPIPYIQAQLGTRSLRSFENIYQHLEIRVPEDHEIIDIVRIRHWARSGEAP